jgi:glutathione S-transferase
MHKIKAGVSELARLIDKRRFAVGDKFGLGDIATGTVLGYLSVRLPEFDWQTLYPSLADYALELEQRTSFQQTIPYPQSIVSKVV